MSNNYSLTVRIPEGLNSKLKNQAKCLGFTKTGMIKLSIHQFLAELPVDLSLVNTSTFTGKPFRLVLNINDYLNALLVDASKTYNLSINGVITCVCILSFQYYDELLTKLGFDD